MDALKNKLSGATSGSTTGGSTTGGNQASTGGSGGGMAQKAIHAIDGSQGGDKLNDKQEKQAGDFIDKQFGGSK